MSSHGVPSYGPKPPKSDGRPARSIWTASEKSRPPVSMYPRKEHPATTAFFVEFSSIP